MASILEFKCKECKKKFELIVGILHEDLKLVSEGEDMPGGGKLPDKAHFASLSAAKSSERAYQFVNDFKDHLNTKCPGEVIFEKYLIT